MVNEAQNSFWYNQKSFLKIAGVRKTSIKVLVVRKVSENSGSIKYFGVEAKKHKNFWGQK